MPSFTTDGGVRLHHTDVGDGPPVLLVAGHTVPLAKWALLTEVLVAAGRRVVAVDRRHTGASDFPPHGMRMSRQGADLHELVIGLGLERPAVVASSMGASAVWAMVDLFGTARLGPLVFVDQTPRMVNGDGWSWGSHGLTWERLDEFVQVFGGPAWTSGSTDFRRASTAAIDERAMPAVQALLATDYPLEVCQPLLRDHAAADWRDVVRRIDVPVLAVGGGRGELWPVEHAIWIAEHAPEGSALVLDDAGHLPFWTEVDAFNDGVLRFLDTHA